MKRLFAVFAVLVLFLSINPAVAGEGDGGSDGADRWFGTGLHWSGHPCGLTAFSLYGRDTGKFNADLVRKYEESKRNPALCREYFPLAFQHEEAPRVAERKGETVKR